MKRLTARRAFWLGAGLILLCNAVALAGVFYNRSGEPDSRLMLTERELRLPHSRALLNAQDNSGLSLRLDVRHTGTDSNRVSHAWLTLEKLRLLGFDTQALFERRSQLRWRDVWLVLELDGVAYKAAVRQARTEFARAEQALQAEPGNSELQKQREAAQSTLADESTSQSRLFLVDADSDPHALRARYPDRQHYALVRGRLKPYIARYEGTSFEHDARVELDIEHINIPHAWRAAFAGWNSHTYGRDRPEVRADIAFGQRQEPWMVSAERPR